MNSGPLRSRLLALVLLFPMSLICVGAQEEPWLQQMCATALSKTGRHGGIPLYLPSALKKNLGPVKMDALTVEETDDGYHIVLWDQCEPPDEDGLQACLFFQVGLGGQALKSAGSEKTFSTEAVKLANGIEAKFRAVSCGGSCAPANLWWRTSDAEY